MNIFKYIIDYAQLSIYKKTGKYASVSCDIKYKPLNEDNIRFDITFFICFPGYPKIAKGFIYIGEDIDVLDENFNTIPSVHLKYIVTLIVEEIYSRDDWEIVEELTNFCLSVERGNHNIDKSEIKEETDINKWIDMMHSHIKKSDFNL